MGQHDKEWGALVTLLVDWKEKWWIVVMGVGLDPELTKWSVCLGPAIVLTEKGYKECHWLVVPHQPLWLSLTSPHSIQCLLPSVLSQALPIISALAMPPFGSMVKLGLVPIKVGPLLLSCTMKRNTV